MGRLGNSLILGWRETPGARTLSDFSTPICELIVLMDRLQVFGFCTGAVEWVDGGPSSNPPRHMTTVWRLTEKGKDPESDPYGELFKYFRGE